MTYAARFLAIFMLLASLWITQTGVYAQDNQPPFIDIVNVDRSQVPTLQLSMVGGHLNGELSALPVKLWESGQEQTIIADQTKLVGIQLALAIDPHNILAPGRSGQTHHAEISGAALDLIENKVITRNVDILAAYSLQADGALQTIQDWTKEPNLIFNSIVQNKPEPGDEARPLTDLLVQVLDKFSTQKPPAPLARSLLLFSPGASQFDLAGVVAKASEQHVAIQVVEMAGADSQNAQTGALQQLAQQTHGTYTLLEADKSLDALWALLTGLRTQRTLTYKSISAAPAPPLKVMLTLPNGSPVEANFNSSSQITGTIESANVTTANVATANVTTANVTTANVTTANVATANVATANVTTANVTTANVATANTTNGNVTTTNGANASGPAAPPSATPATVAPAVAADSSAPAEANAPAVDSGRNDTVVIPGLALAVPRIALQLALPLLILLLAYFIYRDVRERRARAGQSTNLNRRLNSRDSQLYSLNDPVGDLKPLPKSKAKAGDYDLQTNADLPAPVAESLASPRYAPRKSEQKIEDDQNDDATIVPRPAFGDDEATYRLSEQIAQPIIGAFVRVSGNPTLPNEVPVYGLNPARGESRQIHIGRHSKNNTVVINDKSISREHAVIVQKEGRLYLRDNASTAGTFLNGKRLQPGEELLLRHNDLVSFGEVVYEFHAKGEDEATVAGE